MCSTPRILRKIEDCEQSSGPPASKHTPPPSPASRWVGGEFDNNYLLTESKVVTIKSRAEALKRLDETQLEQARQQAPLGAAFVFEDFDDVVHPWKDSFNNVLDSHCPWREKRVKQEAPAPWITKELIKQLYTRDNLLKVARRSDSTADYWANYLIARNKAFSVLRPRARSAKRKFCNNSFEDNKNNARAIWKAKKTLTGPKKSAQ